MAGNKNMKLKILKLKNLINQHDFKIEEMLKDKFGFFNDLDDFDSDDYNSDDNFNSKNNQKRLKNLDKNPYRLTRKSFREK